MRQLLVRVKNFFATMGLVEQSQVVASTAVVVAMGTIMMVYFATGQQVGLFGFMSVVTVGVLGFMSVFFTLKYGRMLEEQRKELMELNAIAEAVNHSVELEYVLQSALIRAMELLGAESGWIYLTENQVLTLKHYHGTTVEFFNPAFLLKKEVPLWMENPVILNVGDPRLRDCATEALRAEGYRIVVSIPLLRQGNVAGLLLIASTGVGFAAEKKIALLQAFGNQVSAALNNASLFEQVKKSEREYADLYEHSPDMYHTVNCIGIVVSCNLKESQMLGIPKNEIIGQPAFELYPPDQHDQLRASLKKIFERGQELQGVEERLQRRDGSLIDVSVSSSIVRDAEGRPALARIVLRDITEKKKMEAKLLQVQKIDSIGNLAGGIAHDFNNILTAILGSASIMKRKVKDDPRWLKYVDLIETTSRRGAAITRQLLTFARKTNPHVHPVDVNAVIEQTLRLFEATTPKSLHIKTALCGEPVIVNADEGQLQQAILNLCLNARDAMPNGGILVINTRPVTVDPERAKQFPDSAPGEYVMISVADSGAGIPQETLGRIYEPFFTTKEQGKGTGLGLSVVYGVIRSHNGHITVNSEVNSGTIFTIYLPRLMNGRLPRSSSTAQGDVVGGTERILLVEDEISIGEVGSDMLTELGYTIETAGDGREAIRKMAEAPKPFDLIILDMNMPRMGGRETFLHVREMFPDQKILVCSGYHATMLDDGKFASMVDGFLQKPYEIAEIAGRIRSILDAGKKEA
ncbi:MAG TPA: ATP-binding protein [Bacteroidota bacterium]|nr:ATP-binding protein [Bacteroidota bacterium]